MSVVLALLAPLIAAPVLQPSRLPTADQMVAEINIVRADPAAYAQDLRRLRRNYDGRIFTDPDGEAVMTQEGVAAMDEAIAFLERQAPLPPLRVLPAISRASEAHARDLERSGRASHSGSDGSSPSERMSREGLWQGMSAENIAFGANDAAGVIRQLIVDDGVPTRGHRETLFSSMLKVAGGACATHREYEQVCVMDYATGFADKAEVRGLSRRDD